MNFKELAVPVDAYTPYAFHVLKCICGRSLVDFRQVVYRFRYRAKRYMRGVR